MIIVVEGHDLSGKTALCSALSSQYGFIKIKPWADLSAAQASLSSISRTLLSMAVADDRHMVFDRFITSEYVYGPLFGRATDYLDELLEEWRDVTPLRVVQLECSESDVMERYDKRGDHMLSRDQVLTARRRYANLGNLMPPWVDLTSCESPPEALAVIGIG